MREWESTNQFPAAQIYVSTAITSGGFQRGHGPGMDPAAKARNEAVAGRLYEALCAAGSVVTATNGMIPTELGRVVGWRDSDYLAFYFAYAAGLNSPASEQFATAFEAHLDQEARAIADNRSLTNDDRWPSYRHLVTQMLEQLDAVRETAGTVTYPPLKVLLQLVDTGYSLGCQAETIYAHHEQMDVLEPAITETDVRAAALAQDLRDLSAANAQCGRSSTPVMPLPVELNAL